MRDYQDMAMAIRYCKDSDHNGCAEKCKYGREHPLNFRCIDYLLADAANILERITPVMAEYRLHPVEAVMYPENAIKNELAGKILSELLKHSESHTLQSRDDPFMNDFVYRMTVNVLTVPQKEVE